MLEKRYLEGGRHHEKKLASDTCYKSKLRAKYERHHETRVKEIHATNG